MPSAVVTPVQLKFCLDVVWIESLIDLGFIDDVSSYETLTDDQLWTYLDKKSEESKETVTLDTLDDIVSKKLRIKISDSDAESRIENLFVSYHSLLRRHGLSWIIKDNQKIAVYHVLSAIRPESLRSRLESNLDFSHHHLRKNFKSFINHAIKLSKSFQLVDNGPEKTSPNKTSKDKTTKSQKGRGGNNNGKSNASSTSSDRSSSNLPVCLYGPHKAKGYRQLLRDCTACPDDEKKSLLKARAEEMAKDGPSKSTRGQKAAAQASSDSNAKAGGNVAGRLKPSTNQHTSSFFVTVTDGSESMTASGRTDDGSDESIVSSKLTESAVLAGIGKMKKISPVSLQVALTDDEDAQ